MNALCVQPVAHGHAYPSVWLHTPSKQEHIVYMMPDDVGSLAYQL